MEEKKIEEIRSHPMVQKAWNVARFLLPDENISPEEAMKWDKFLMYVHYSVRRLHDVKPETWTEKGFYQWIAEKTFIQPILDHWLDYNEQINKEKRKCNNKAKQLKEQGNNFFKKKRYSESVKKFTESARHATNDDNCFSIAIANRSAAFFHMGLFKECLLDIELSIKIGYPEEMSWKLHLRAAQAHLKLRQGKLAKDSLTALQKIVESSKEIGGTMRETILKQAKDLSSAAEANQMIGENIELTGKAKMRPIPEDMLKKNSTFPFVSAAVRREQSPTRGRYVVAEQSIKKGDVLFVEKPFAWVPLTDDKNVSVCAHCGGPMDEALVPCRGCLDALYCNSTCWNDAWSYHQWECPGNHMGIWQPIGVSHLAFKSLLMSITTNDTARFNDVQQLLTNIEDKPVDDIVGLAITSTLVTTYIEKYTNFFETVDLKESLIDKFVDDKLSFDVDVSTRKGKKDYVGSTILRHMLQMLCNGFAAQYLVDLSPSNEIVSWFQWSTKIGVGTYPSSSMINHSCDPTVRNCFWNNYWLIVKALKDIRKGEEIFISYGPHFRQTRKDERQTHLRNTYFFDCRCSACANPRLDHYEDRFHGLKCLKCYGSSLPSSSFDSQRCLDCFATGNVTCNDALQEAKKLYNEGFKLVVMKEIASSFEKSLKIREKYLYKHNELIVNSLEELRRFHALTGHCLKSISYMERIVAATEERYGLDSIEVANVLNNITKVGFAYLKNPLNRRSTEYRDIFIKTREYLDRTLLILNLMVGPWDSTYQDLNDKREELS